MVEFLKVLCPVFFRPFHRIGTRWGVVRPISSAGFNLPVKYRGECSISEENCNFPDQGIFGADASFVVRGG